MLPFTPSRHHETDVTPRSKAQLDGSHQDWEWRPEYDQFMKVNKSSQIMGFYNHSRSAFLLRLAISSRRITSLLGTMSTYPNRFFLLAGTSFGSKTTCLRRGRLSTKRTIFDVLDYFHVSWKY